MVVNGVLESISIALFIVFVVFGVLCMLWGAIRLFSTIIQAIENSKNKSLSDTND